SRLVGAGLVEARAGGHRLRWIAAITAVVLVALAVYLVTREPADAVAGATSPPVVAPVAEHPPPAAAPPPDPPAAPTKVRLRIVSRPADATVLLDNKRLGKTPLDETVDADPGKHVLKLRRKGYAVYKLDVTLDADVTQDIALTRSAER
ncbi:MAG TPA: PEGA domain-containing protein, partial [Kofleriaceae bacterium]|nr:PEGA domain-containing protein [Kofleriaceae bacterium]